VEVKDHLEKVKRLRTTVESLDAERDFETIIEICYGMTMHLIAVLCQRRLGEHRDTHKGLAKYLDDKGQAELSALLREMDLLRVGRWYGRSGDGDAAKRVLDIVALLFKEVEAGG